MLQSYSENSSLIAWRSITVSSQNGRHDPQFGFPHFLPFGLRIFFCGTTVRGDPRPSVLRFLDHTQLDTQTHTHTHSVGHLCASDQHSAETASQKNTKQTQQTNIFALRGILNRDSRNQAAVDLRHRPHGHRDRPTLRLLL